MNGILADEMGLGKTIQIIALMCYVIKCNVKGPFLIVVPLSTLMNWKSEFTKFAPELPVIIVHGNKTERLEALSKLKNIYEICNKSIQPIMLTTYEVIHSESSVFESVKWKYVIVDEGHRLKNPQSIITQ